MTDEEIIHPKVLPEKPGCDTGSCPTKDISIEQLSPHITDPELRYKFDHTLTQATVYGWDSQQLAERVVESLGREPVLEAMERMAESLKKEGQSDDGTETAEMG